MLQPIREDDGDLFLRFVHATMVRDSHSISYARTVAKNTYDLWRDYVETTNAVFAYTPPTAEEPAVVSPPLLEEGTPSATPHPEEVQAEEAQPPQPPRRETKRERNERERTARLAREAAAAKAAEKTALPPQEEPTGGVEAGEVAADGEGVGHVVMLPVGEG